MKKVDLSTRSNAIVGQQPIFSRRNTNPNGTLTFTGAATLDMFVAPGICTVLWIQIQLGSTGTVQLVKSGEPISAAYNLNAGAIIRFAGMLLSGNEKLSLSSLGVNSIVYEVAWVKETQERLIVTDSFISNPAVAAGGVSSVNLAQQNGVALASPIADAPIGTEVAPVVRGIFRKRQTLITTAALLANGVFTSGWIDSELTGDFGLRLFSVSNVVGASVIIQESDDQVNTFTIASQSQSTTTFTIQGWVRARYYRVIYTNGVTNQTTFSLYVTASNFSLASTPYQSNVSDATVVFSNGGPASTFLDGVTVACKSAFTNPAGSADAQAVSVRKYNGSTMDRDRNNVNTVTGDTGAKVATFNGATQTNFDGLGGFITILLGVVSGTTPTLSVQLQYSPDGGTTWVNLGPALPNLTLTNQTGLIGIFPTNFSQAAGATPANLTSGASVQLLLNAILPRTWRLVYTIAGTTPSFAISSVNVNYMKA
jgi:hypothetical protein